MGSTTCSQPMELNLCDPRGDLCLEKTHEVLNFWISRNLKSWSHIFKFLFISQLSCKRNLHNSGPWEWGSMYKDFFSGPHLFPSFTTCQKNPFATPRTVLQRAKKSLCNRSQFRTLFLPSHQRPVSTEFLTICRIPEFPKSEQNRQNCGNVRIWRKRAAVRRKNHSNLNKSFGINFVNSRVPLKFVNKFWKI